MTISNGIGISICASRSFYGVTIWECARYSEPPTYGHLRRRRLLYGSIQLI